MKVAAVKSPGGLDKLVIEERAIPKPGPGEILGARPRELAQLS